MKKQSGVTEVENKIIEELNYEAIHMMVSSDGKQLVSRTGANALFTQEVKMEDGTIGFEGGLAGTMGVESVAGLLDSVLQTTITAFRGYGIDPTDMAKILAGLSANSIKKVYTKEEITDAAIERMAKQTEKEELLAVAQMMKELVESQENKG